MVEEVQAWRAADGSLHSARLDAAKQDAMIALGKLDIFNHASSMAIIKVAADIVPILQQVIDATPKEPSDA